jgi:adenosylhomocysteine nucleosidase
MELVNVAGKRILFVMAAQAEYGPCLQARFRPLMTGVGPVESAVSVAAALARLSGEGMAPHLLVSLGSAGSRRLAQGSVHQVSAVSYRDMDASPLGFPKGLTPFLDIPAVLELPLRIPDVPAATISTGADIVSGSAYDAIAEDMVDMETFAVLRAAMAFDVPLIGLRGISDGAAELTHVGDWTQYLHIVDERLADAVDRLEKAVVAGELLP